MQAKPGCFCASVEGPAGFDHLPRTRSAISVARDVRGDPSHNHPEFRDVWFK